LPYQAAVPVSRVMGAGPWVGGAVTGKVADEAVDKDGAGAAVRAEGPTVPAHAAVDNTTAQSTQALRNGIIL